MNGGAVTDDKLPFPDSRERPSDWRGPRAWLLPRPDMAVAWLEVIVITLVAIGVAWYADPRDPLHVRSQFPWPWFASVLVALRYGPVQGVASALLLMVSWYLLSPGAGTEPIPKYHFLGGLLLTLICAEFSGAWRLRLRRMFELNRYLDDRVERVTRRLYLLRLSHDRLEQELLSRPTTMRDAIVQLRERLVDAREPGPLPGAQMVLSFLAQHCQLEAAALYSLSQDDEEKLQRVARLGPAVELTAQDPLLAYVLDRGELAHVQAEGLAEHVATPQLLVAPITTSDGRLLGVLSVSRMPFFALNQDTLQLLDVLLGAYADTVVIGPGRAAVRDALPDATDEFAEELARLVRVARDFGIDSRVVAFAFGDHPLALDVQGHILRGRRAPDIAWTPVRPQLRAALVVLLPIASDATVDGYLVRTEASLRETFGGGFSELRVRAQPIALLGGEAPSALARALQAPPLAPSPTSGNVAPLPA
jgi:hypothetical protein